MAPLPLSTASSHPPSTPAEPRPKKRKTAPPSTLHTSTLRPQHTYFHLRLTTPTPTSPSSSSSGPAHLDPLTIRTLLTPPLQSYLGLTGAGIPIDILKSEGKDVWVRVRGEDARALQAGVGAWVGGVEGGLVPGEGGEEGSGEKRVRVAWRVVRRGGRLGGGDGGELFG
ncbi:hypothetical protein P171DRAFT_521963 [Karstenula rhodostoma CBS 690.94]|uniref:Ribonucleases P/MRP subunit Pop8-like domain-containing protein n=1 Tax=Karstenula rhodostoma CBS 690.94 TaxID=1392251 RepID=A0A9P4PG47_9PLEO|nr:hypothetical protein P171DRAFT_521963 [Karstenula rhodostoma CBS 690.94]